MIETIKLRNPIEINGKKVKELSYDLDLITPAAFAEANGKKSKSVGATNISGATAELDYTFHLYLAFAAIIAVDPEIDYADLERITGRDVGTLMQIGRGFFIELDDSAQSSSEEPSEITPESITQA